MNQLKLSRVLDYERGYLDRKHCMGYCGCTPEYDAGYNETGREDSSMQEAQAQRKEIVMRGWLN